jgi:tetratricopeptide (TPR) repeat protein
MDAGVVGLRSLPRPGHPSTLDQEFSELQTSDPDALMREAMAASQRHDSDTALALLARVSELAPSAAVPYLLTAGELAQMGRYDEAETAYVRAILLDPNLYIARFQLGLLQFTSGKVPMAMLTWQPLTTLGDEHPLSLIVRGFAELAQDNMSEAAGLFHAGMAANKDNEPLNRDIAMVLQRMADAGGGGKPAEPAPLEQPAKSDALSSAHVLLSNYGPLQ